jgi:hypothetical protein
MSLKSGSEVLSKDFKSGVVYNYGIDLNPLYNFIVLEIYDYGIYISGHDFKHIEGLEYANELNPYYFVRELTELEKALL